MKTLTNNLISKYEKIAVNVKVKDDKGIEYDMKKVPSKNIYIVNGNLNSFRPKGWKIPTTLIVKGNVNIIGDSSSNLLIIATGKVRFNLASPNLSDG
jgi:hypothetical protein